MSKKNIFIIGKDESNMEFLQRLPGAENYEFHAALDYSDIRGEDIKLNITHLLGKCEDRINDFNGTVDGIIGYFDFPVTTMIPILCKSNGLPSASLESVLKCEHKYWSRLEQAKVIPDHIPRFEAFDPFDEEPMSGIDLLFPYWIKPIRSFRSFLAFRINSDQDFLQNIGDMRRNITSLSRPFDSLLKFFDLPPEVSDIKGRTCLAESLLSGSMCTLEGYVYDGEPTIYGIVDSIREADRSSFSRYEYPSKLPEDVQKRMIDVGTRIIKAIGYNNAPFNMEFFFDQTSNNVFLLEINTRLSQSHAYIFEKVHGTSHFQVMVDLALGQKPNFPTGTGPYKQAAKYMLRTFEDGFVTKVPGEQEIQRLMNQVEGAKVEILVTEGKRLSQLQNQDSYSYEIADLYLCANSDEELFSKYQKSLELLDFRVSQELNMTVT